MMLKHLITKRVTMYLVLVLGVLIATIGIINRVYIDPKSIWHIFIRDFEFFFGLGMFITLFDMIYTSGVSFRKSKHSDDWQLINATMKVRNILDKDEDLKYIVNYSFGGWAYRKFDLLTSRRILRYQKYFGITKEIRFGDVRRCDYKISDLLMTMRFEADQSEKIFEIMIMTDFQHKIAVVLEKIMAEKGD